MSSPGRARVGKRRPRAQLSIVVRGRARKLIKKQVLPYVAKHLRRVLHAADVAERACTLSLVDDDEIRALNKQYAREDHATDVLSFAQDPPLLGDIVISLETALPQSKERGIPIEDEVIYLAIHGVAHLQGLDHRNKREEKIMFGYTSRLFSECYSGYSPELVPLPKISSRKPRRA